MESNTRKRVKQHEYAVIDGSRLMAVFIIIPFIAVGIGLHSSVGTTGGIFSVPCPLPPACQGLLVRQNWKLSFTARHDVQLQNAIVYCRLLSRAWRWQSICCSVGSSSISISERGSDCYCNRMITITNKCSPCARLGCVYYPTNRLSYLGMRDALCIQTYCS